MDVCIEDNFKNGSTTSTIYIMPLINLITISASVSIINTNMNQLAYFELKNK